MIFQRWLRNGLGSVAALLFWRASICFYPAYTFPARMNPCSVWQNTAMWLRVIKSIKALTSCNLIFHFVHIHKCLIELKLNTKKFERPNLYILFSLYRIDVISQRNYKTPLLRKCSSVGLFKLSCFMLEVWWQAFPAFKSRSFVLLGSDLCPGAALAYSTVFWKLNKWVYVKRSAGDGVRHILEGEHKPKCCVLVEL